MKLRTIAYPFLLFLAFGKAQKSLLNPGKGAGTPITDSLTRKPDIMNMTRRKGLSISSPRNLEKHNPKNRPLTIFNVLLSIECSRCQFKSSKPLSVSVKFKARNSLHCLI